MSRRYNNGDGKPNLCEMVYYKRTSNKKRRFIFVPIEKKKRGYKNVYKKAGQYIIISTLFLSLLWVVLYGLATYLIPFGLFLPFVIFKKFIVISYIIYIAISIGTFRLRRLKMFKSFLKKNQEVLTSCYLDTVNGIIEINYDYLDFSNLWTFPETRNMLGKNTKNKNIIAASEFIMYHKLLEISYIFDVDANKIARVKLLNGLSSWMDYTWNFETDSLISVQQKYSSQLSKYFLKVCRLKPFSLGEKSRQYLENYKNIIINDIEIDEEDRDAFKGEWF